MESRVIQMIRDSNNIVVISGLELMLEAGVRGMHREEAIYEIEKKYGFSSEEILSVTFFNRKVDAFFDFYKQYVLDLKHMQPTQAHYAMAKLEQQGKLSTVITRTVTGLHQMAGIQNVIELYGSIHHNTCSRCNRDYPAEYIATSSEMPKCETCHMGLKLGISLYGERLDNAKMSQSIEKVSQADVLILAGTSISSYMGRWLLPYYEGEKLILIKNKEEASDKKANYVFYGESKDILPRLVQI